MQMEKIWVKRVILKAFLLVVGLSIMSGCSHKQTVNLQLKYVTADSVPVRSNDVDAQEQVAAAASSVDSTLQQLSALELSSHGNKQGNRLEAMLDVPQMSQQASVDWNGPVQPILNKIADTVGYRLRVLGQEPAIPVLVILNAQNQPLGDILRNVIYQVTKRADIRVDNRRRIIELRYYS
jgi:defect-in-organelle-trafficking protein DotD